MYPNKEYKNAKVGAVKYYEWNHEKKAKYISESIYDRCGYLTFQTNKDSAENVINEIISVSFLADSVRKITRRISVSEFIKMGKKTPPGSIDAPYRPIDISEYKNRLKDTLEFISFLQWKMDSSVSYKGYLGYTLLDSGRTESIRIVPVGQEIWNCTTRVVSITANIRDSIIRCGSESYPEPGDYSLKEFTISEGKIRKSIYQFFKNGKVVKTSIGYYKYDTKGRLSVIEYFNDRNSLFEKVIYDYTPKGSYYTMNEKYINGKIDLKTVFNQKGKVIKELHPAMDQTKFISETLYSYYANGLLKSIEHWYGKTKYKESKFVYSFFE